MADNPWMADEVMVLAQAIQTTLQIWFSTKNASF
jgi:hypothetical protein